MVRRPRQSGDEGVSEAGPGRGEEAGEHKGEGKAVSRRNRRRRKGGETTEC